MDLLFAECKVYLANQGIASAASIDFSVIFIGKGRSWSSAFPILWSENFAAPIYTREIRVANL